ncbi:hypothetical protein BJY14_007659 [Actinomadura luteofluorescens]|uniref:Uncharacterized protein n=1 Tax=Actinomadura luteofluorescens TaxID=46163 RepID=A0A7Y9EQ35_9ACTN|nr:hypothetical protein [Actinomadura luteofluorescens]
MHGLNARELQLTVEEEVTAEVTIFGSSAFAAFGLPAAL